jgi:hypothetical protein
MGIAVKPVLQATVQWQFDFSCWRYHVLATSAKDPDSNLHVGAFLPPSIVTISHSKFMSVFLVQLRSDISTT